MILTLLVCIKVTLSPQGIKLYPNLIIIIIIIIISIIIIIFCIIDIRCSTFMLG